MKKSTVLLLILAVILLAFVPLFAMRDKELPSINCVIIRSSDTAMPRKNSLFLY